MNRRVSDTKDRVEGDVIKGFYVKVYGVLNLLTGSIIAVNCDVFIHYNIHISEKPIVRTSSAAALSLNHTQP